MLVRSRSERGWWLSTAMAFAFSPASSTAETAPQREMEEVVVTATRLPTPRLKVASSTTVVTAEDIKRRQLRTVPDALRTVPGLHVVRGGGPGQQTSVFMRGASSAQTLVLIDGIVANDPSNPNGQMDLGNLLADNIDRIEVVRGPQSTLYGADAIGGVINIITRRGEGPLAGTARAERGSDDTTNTQGGLSGARGSLDYSASLNYINTDANSVTPKRLRDGARKEDDSYRNWTGSARLGWAPTEITELSFTGRYVNAEKTNIDPELEQFGFGTTEDRDAFLDSKEYFLRGDGKVALFDGVWDSALAVSYTDYDRDSRNDRRDPFTETLDRTNFEGDRLAFEWKNDLYLFEDHIITAGVETEKENAKSSGFTAFGTFVIFQDTNADDRTSAFYLQDQFSINDRWFGTAGFRVDHSDDFGTEPTFRIAPVYLHKETRTRVAGSVGTGFKAPSLFERFGFTPNNFGRAFRGNPDLDAETSLGWELGVDQALFGDRVTIGATYFWSRIEDLIQTVFFPDGNSTTENVEEVHSRGVETYVSAQLRPQLSVRVDYTYTKADEDDGGAKLLRRPSHKLNGDVNFKPRPNITLSATATYVARWRDIDRLTVERVSPSSYAVVDVAASYAVNKWLTVLARIDNATDERYEPSDGFEAPGRRVFGGIKLTL